MMRNSAILVAMMTLCGSSILGATEPAKPRISGPYTHDNLTLFLIHGPDAITGRTFVTLKEALERKIVVVNETSNVNMLSIENTSTDIEVFVMAGDVVKGGKQDRTMAFDQVIPPKSGTMPLPSFCVEHGRWRKRGGESEKGFACSDAQIVGKGLRNAVNDSRQQSEVWNEVAKAQSKLSENVGKSVQNAASPTSLQLCLEDKDLKEKLAKYESPFAKLLDDHKDAIGIVTVINGQVTGADAFCSADLFAKLWAKLLKSACAEALSEFKADKKFEACKLSAVESFLLDAAKGESQELSMVPTQQEGVQTMNVIQGQSAAGQQHVEQANNAAVVTPPPPPPTSTAKVRVVKYTNAKSSLLECQEKDNQKNVVHRCYIAK